MADSLDGWIARRLESYARKHGLECDTAEPGKLIQVHKWLTFESPYWARVGDSELSILAVFSEESALKYRTQTGRSITSLRRAVLRLTSIRPTLILPFAKAQTRDLAFDVLAFTVMNSGGEHEPVYYDRVKDTSKEMNRGQLRDWVDGLKRKYNQIGLRPIQTSPTTDSTEPYPSTRPAPTLVQPSSSIGSSANTSLPPPPHASSLPSNSAKPSESELPPKTKPKNILDLSWWIIPPDQQILLDAIDESSCPRPLLSWYSTSSHPAQLSREVSPPSSVPEKTIPPTTTTESPVVDQDSEEELSIRKPRAIGTNAGTVKGSLLQPAQQIPSAPEIARHTEPVAPPLATPPPPKLAPSTSVSADVNVAAIVTVDANNDTDMTQNKTDVAHPKGLEHEKSLLASQSQTITHSSPSSTRPSLPPLSQPQFQSRSPPQQHGSHSIPPRLSSTAPLQHTVVFSSDKPDGISRTTEAQDGTKKPLGRASSTVLVPNSDTDSLSRSQSLPSSWPPTEPSSSQPSQARPLDQPQSFSPPRPSTQPSVSGSQTQSLSQTQTQSPSQSAEKTVPPIIHPPLVQVPDRIVSTSETTVESIPTIPAVESTPVPTVTNVNSRKRPVLDEILTTQNEQKRPKTDEPTIGPNFGQDQNQNQPDKQVAATTAAVAANTTTAATTTSSKTWSTVPMLRTGQSTYPDQPLDSQLTQTQGAETIEFSQMPDTQQRETVRAALAQGRSSFSRSSETAAATGSLRPLVPVSVAVDRHNGKNQDSEQTSGGGGSIKKSAPARIVADTPSLQPRSLERSPAPATDPTATFTPTSVPVALPTLASTSAPTPAPIPAPVPMHAPAPPPTRPARKVFKLQRTLPLAPGLPSEADVLALLREAKRWASSKQTDQTFEKRSG